MSDSSPGSDNPFVAGMALLAEASNLGFAQRLEATALAYQALRAFERVPTRRGQAAARLLIGQLAYFTQDLGEAREHLVAARDLFQVVGISSGQAQASQTLGQVLVRVEDYDAARVEFASALELLTGSEDERAAASTHRLLGSLERRGGNPQRAIEHYQEAETRFVALGDIAGLASVRLSLGNLLSAMGSTRRAMEAYATAGELFEQVEDQLGEANAVRFYGDAARRDGQRDTAEEAYQHALAMYITLGDHLGESFVHFALGEMANGDENPEQAIAHLKRAAEIFAQANDPQRLVQTVATIADLHIRAGHKMAALDAMVDGIASARLASRWSVNDEVRDRTEAIVDRIEARALDLAIELGEGTLAGAVIESGVAGLVGLLPLLLDGPTSPDQRTEELRQRVRALAQRLQDVPPRPDTGDESSEETGPPTRSNPGSRHEDAANERAAVIAELEGLLGPRAREVVVPEPTDFNRLLARASKRRTVVQYSCPQGIAEGSPIYVVWSCASRAPTVSRSVLSARAAERLTILTGTRLVGSKGDDEMTEVPPDALRARGLGVRPGGAPGKLSEARRIARRTNELWSHLDRDPRADPAVSELSEALFPSALIDHLTGTVDPVTGVPGRVLIVPGAQLWNLPWTGMPVAGAGVGQRLIELARVSLTPSLSSCRPEPNEDDSQADWTRPAWTETRGGKPMAVRRADLPRVNAWIPEGAVKGTVVERAMVGAVFGSESLADSAQTFLTRLGEVDAAIASVHGQSEVGLAHGVFLAPGHSLSAADLVGMDLPMTFIIGACWSARVNPDAHAEPFALPLIALARGVDHLIGGTYPLPDAPPFPTARLLTQLYPALLGTDPATALWLAQHEASDSGAAPHTWAGLTHTTALA